MFEDFIYIGNQQQVVAIDPTYMNATWHEVMTRDLMPAATCR